MGNRHKGQVTRKIDGVAYTFELSVNAFCEIEDATGETMTQLFGRLQTGMKTGQIGMRDLRLLFWGALTEHHPDLDQRAAGRLLSGIGDMTEQLAFVEDVFNTAMPDTDKAGAGKVPGKTVATA